MKNRQIAQPPSSSPGLRLSSLPGRTDDTTDPIAGLMPTNVTLAPASHKRDCDDQLAPNADIITTVDPKTSAEFDRSLLSMVVAKQAEGGSSAMTMNRGPSSPRRTEGRWRL